MGELDIAQTTNSDLTDNIVDYSVNAEDTDSAGESKETEYINTDWTKQLGYYKSIPELAMAIDAKATWTVGKGFIADDTTTLILDRIKGWGKDTFNTIIENLIRTMYIGGDSFAEIITDDDNTLINLKPLNPGKIKIVANRQGLITKYVQVDKGQKDRIIPTHKMFHLARNRVADEIHGVSIVNLVEWIILARNEAMTDWKRVMHRNVEPMFIFHLNTDNQTKIDALITKYNNARKDGENMFIPKNSVEVETVSVAGNANLNPLEWIDRLTKYFFQAVGVPDIIIGGGSSASLTEASAKIAYLAFEQTIEEAQLQIEESFLRDINLEINFEFPASLENEMLSDKPKVENRGLEQGDQAMQPNDTTAEMEGNK